MSDKSKQRARALANRAGISYQAAVNRVRKAKGLPDHAGFTTASRLFFRPFDALASGFDRERIPVRGEIRGRQFVVHVLGQQVELETIEVLRDKRGNVAVLEQGKYPLRDGFELDVGFEAFEPIAEGFEPTIQSMISVRREGSIRQAVREATEERLGPVNLVMGYENNYSLYFHADGTVESWLIPDQPQPSSLDHEPSELCFSHLDDRLLWLFRKEHYSDKWRSMSRVAFDAFHAYAASQVRPWGWGRPFPSPSTDPIDAAFHDAFQAAQRWVQPMARRRDVSSRDLVKPEDRPTYSKTLGLIAHAVKDALAASERLHNQAPATHGG